MWHSAMSTVHAIFHPCSDDYYLQAAALDLFQSVTAKAWSVNKKSIRCVDGLAVQALSAQTPKGSENLKHCRRQIEYGKCIHSTIAFAVIWFYKLQTIRGSSSPSFFIFLYSVVRLIPSISAVSLRFQLFPLSTFKIMLRSGPSRASLRV